MGLQVLLIATGLSLFPAMAKAQTPSPSNTGEMGSPLAPADLSSPRATLAGFLADTERVIEGLIAGTPDQAALRRAASALDFSATPNGDSWDTRVRRLVMLREILRRLNLPPVEAIPSVGDEVDAWTVPGSAITIAGRQSVSGPRHFVFTAATVQRIDRDYRRIRGSPFLRGADQDFYEAIFQGGPALDFGASLVERRLRPPDTTSPLATLEQFLESVNRAYALSIGSAAVQAEAMSRAARDAAAADWMAQAAAALDLSGVPEALREDTGVEAALHLKEVLDRMPLPPLDAVPDALSVAAARDGQALSQWTGDAPLRWRYPNTEIEIVEIGEGERQGDFLFSARTVRDADVLYREVADLPYRPTTGGVIEAGYASPGTSPGFLSIYRSTPGDYVPRASWIGRLVADGPEQLRAIHGGQPLWKWLVLGMTIAVGAAVAYGSRTTTARLYDRVGSQAAAWVAVLPPLMIAAVAAAIGWIVDDGVNMTGAPRAIVEASMTAVVIAMAAWAAYLISCAVAETLAAGQRMRDDLTNATVIRIGARILGFMIVVAIVVAGLRHLGADLVPLIAGLGVGGLAVALAAQRTFANLIGSLILFVNKPVRVGDFVRYGDQIGTVEAIGLLATRIRSLERTIVTVPNAQLSEMQLDNYSARDERLLSTTLQLRYETTPEQMRYVLARLREMLLGHPMVTPEPARVRLAAFGAYSKDVEVFAYLRCHDHNVFCAIREDVLLRIEDIVAEAGTGFAFPSQTAYLARDGGVDSERAQTAQARVGEWRTKGKLPFPEFEDEERERLEDTLDYPPRGSPDYRSRI